MATSLLTKYQNRRKESHLGHMYRSSRHRAGQRHSAYQQAYKHLRGEGGLQDKYGKAKDYAKSTQEAMENWQTEFDETDVAKGMQDVMSRWGGFGLTPNMGSKNFEKTVRGLGFGEGLNTLAALKKEYDHSLTRTYSGVREKDLDWYEKMFMDPRDWYESYDTTAEERQKRKDAWESFRDIDLTDKDGKSLGITYGQIQGDITNWGAFKSSKTYKDYFKGMTARTKADAAADKTVGSYEGETGLLQQGIDAEKRMFSLWNTAKSDMVRMQSMYHGARQRSARRGTSKGGTQKKSSILLGYA